MLEKIFGRILFPTESFEETKLSSPPPSFRSAPRPVLGSPRCLLLQSARRMQSFYNISDSVGGTAYISLLSTINLLLEQVEVPAGQLDYCFGVIPPICRELGAPVNRSAAAAASSFDSDPFEEEGSVLSFEDEDLLSSLAAEEDVGAVDYDGADDYEEYEDDDVENHAGGESGYDADEGTSSRKLRLIMRIEEGIDRITRQLEADRSRRRLASESIDEVRRDSEFLHFSPRASGRSVSPVIERLEWHLYDPDYALRILCQILGSGFLHSEQTARIRNSQGARLFFSRGRAAAETAEVSAAASAAADNDSIWTLAEQSLKPFIDSYRTTRWGTAAASLPITSGLFGEEAEQEQSYYAEGSEISPPRRSITEPEEPERNKDDRRAVDSMSGQWYDAAAFKPLPPPFLAALRSAHLTGWMMNDLALAKDDLEKARGWHDTGKPDGHYQRSPGRTEQEFWENHPQASYLCYDQLNEQFADHIVEILEQRENNALSGQVQARRSKIQKALLSGFFWYAILNNRSLSLPLKNRTGEARGIEDVSLMIEFLEHYQVNGRETHLSAVRAAAAAGAATGSLEVLWSQTLRDLRQIIDDHHDFRQSFSQIASIHHQVVTMRRANEPILRLAAEWCRMRGQEQEPQEQ